MPAEHSRTVSRRSFLLARSREPDAAIRPPWFDADTRTACTGCNACVEACPESILALGPDAVPAVGLNGGACTFCGACAEACDAGVFDTGRVPPWNVTVALDPGCLMDLGISCRLCTDACDSSALVFDARGGVVGALRVDADRCTGCGACVGLCPAEVLRLDAREREAA
ncbi:ferredoxin-type protein NapF [Sulfitobacter sp. D35]|uniref:ferredoxin-type protein NapF n=1 Tax=Sulfitobacter sp. D35 TaxID=3083252 RepID=UPI00296FB0EF|nr:ferredoxin-type protein NapF [Sulfitobacter sp. D35]MDW4498496.1 ferredoxin-type protein NapF [Sulfitobacter sp. D35]